MIMPEHEARALFPGRTEDETVPKVRDVHHISHATINSQ